MLHQDPRSQGRRHRWAVVLIAVGLTLAGCGDSDPGDQGVATGGDNGGAGEVSFDDQPTESAEPTPTEEPVDDTVADERIPETVTEMFSWNIAEDESPADAIERSRDYLDRSWIRETESRWAGLTNATSSEWDEWDQADAVDTRVDLEESDDERPKDSPRATYRGYTVTQRIVDRDDRVVATRSFDVFTVSARAGDVWKIVDLTVLD